MKKILIIGASVFFGSYCFSRFKLIKEYNALGTRFKNSDTNLILLDYKNISEFILKLNEIKPDIILWSAGNKDINLLETDFEICINNNIKPIEVLVNYIKKEKNVRLIYLSSDYVFNGEKGDYLDKDIATPNTNYGKSKLIAETIIQESIKNFSIIRVGAIIGKGSQFWDWLVFEFKNNYEIGLFDDIFSPTPKETLFLAIKRCIELNLNGVFHISGNKNLSRYELGMELKSILKEKKIKINKIKKSPNFIINRSLKRSKEFEDFKSLDLKKLLDQND